MAYSDSLTGSNQPGYPYWANPPVVGSEPALSTAPTEQERQPLWRYLAFGEDNRFSPRDVFRYLSWLGTSGTKLGWDVGKYYLDMGWDKFKDWYQNRNQTPDGAPSGGYNYPETFVGSPVGPSKEPWKYAPPQMTPDQADRWMDDWQSSMHPTGDFTDPFGAFGLSNGPEGAMAASIGDRVGGRASALAEAMMERQATRPPASPSGPSPYGQTSSSGGMSVSQLQMPSGPPIPVISGPRWEGPPGLPWTYGADPRSYPYAYIPPGESWENVGAPPGVPPGGVPPQVPERNLRDLFNEYFSRGGGGRRTIQGGPSAGGSRPVARAKF